MKCVIESVVLSPSDVASLCVGGRLVFTCTTNQSIIRWNVTTSQSGRIHTRTRLVSPTSQSTIPLLVNMNSFNVTRNSSYGSLPLTSVLSIANVSVDLNETKVSCTGVGSSTAEASTLVATVHVFTAADLGKLNYYNSGHK